MMKKHFLTGLALLLPAILTLFIVAFFVNLLTDPFINAIEGVFNYYQVQGIQNWSLSQNALLLFSIRIVILIIIFLFIILIGFLTQTFFLHSLAAITDRLILRIPFVNKIYKALQEIIHTLFSSQGSSFKQVVLIPYPHATSLSIGFVAADTTSSSDEAQIQEKIPVFVPGTPNPTFGFILMFPKDQLIYIDMKVEDAFKLLISCGIMLPSQNGPSDETKT